jgi:hypothetical protein
MPDMDAMLRIEPKPIGGTRSRTIPIRPPVSYEQFREMARTAALQIQKEQRQKRGVISIPRLRRALSPVAPALFEEHLLRMERNGLVHLITPEDVQSLSDDDRRESLRHPSGDIRSFILWLSPKAQPLYCWD